MRRHLALLLLALLVSPAAALVADHEACGDYLLIPGSTLQSIRDNYDFFYGHTSHGSQIMTGLDILVDEDPVAFARPSFHEISDDLGHNGDISWVAPTISYLDAHPECNVVMWSWCGGCSDNTEAGIAAYLSAMETLESDYPEVIFVYMTGHLDGTGTGGNLYARNDQIRQYCATHDKVLFDFADIESWDPDGVFYPDETDACAWCSAWCSSHSCPTCGGCAHSHCFNCYQKGKAFWWLLGALRTGLSVGVDPAAGDVPLMASPALAQNSPNPFNPCTEIRFTLARPTHVTLEVLDLSGRVVAVLEDGRRDAGDHVVTWSGSGDDGHRIASGTYFYRLRADGAAETRKMILLK